MILLSLSANQSHQSWRVLRESWSTMGRPTVRIRSLDMRQQDSGLPRSVSNLLLTRTGSLAHTARQWSGLLDLGLRVKQDHRAAPGQRREGDHEPDPACCLRCSQIRPHVHEHVSCNPHASSRALTAGGNWNPGRSASLLSLMAQQRRPARRRWATRLPVVPRGCRRLSPHGRVLILRSDGPGAFDFIQGDNSSTPQYVNLEAL